MQISIAVSITTVSLIIAALSNRVELNGTIWKSLGHEFGLSERDGLRARRHIVGSRGGSCTSIDNILFVLEIWSLCSKGAAGTYCTRTMSYLGCSPWVASEGNQILLLLPWVSVLIWDGDHVVIWCLLQDGIDVLDTALCWITSLALSLIPNVTCGALFIPSRTVKLLHVVIWRASSHRWLVEARCYSLCCKMLDRWWRASFLAHRDSSSCLIT